MINASNDLISAHENTKVAMVVYFHHDVNNTNKFSKFGAGSSLVLSGVAKPLNLTENERFPFVYFVTSITSYNPILLKQTRLIYHATGPKILCSYCHCKIGDACC